MSRSRPHVPAHDGPRPLRAGGAAHDGATVGEDRDLDRRSALLGPLALQGGANEKPVALDRAVRAEALCQSGEVDGLARARGDLHGVAARSRATGFTFAPPWSA